MEKLLTIYCLNDYNYCYVYFSFFRHLVNYYKIFGGLLSNMTINRRNVFLFNHTFAVFAKYTICF